MNKFRATLESLLDERKVPYLGIDDTVSMDGIAVEFRSKEYAIKAHMFADYLTTPKPITIGRFHYNDLALEALMGVADMAREFRRWRKMPGFNVPEIVFAFGERSFLAGRKHWADAGHMHIYAMYRVRCVNSNYETFKKLISDHGIRAKFVGQNLPFLLKEKDFAKVTADPFYVMSESYHQPMCSLPTDPNTVLAWYERRQKTITTNRAECEAHGITIAEERVQLANFLVQVPREEFVIPLLFPHEWD
jgi:hypothetical protein